MFKYNLKNESALKAKFEFSAIPLVKSNPESKKRTLSITAR